MTNRKVAERKHPCYSQVRILGSSPILPAIVLVSIVAFFLVGCPLAAAGFTTSPFPFRSHEPIVHRACSGFYPFRTFPRAASVSTGQAFCSGGSTSWSRPSSSRELLSSTTSLRLSSISFPLISPTSTWGNIAILSTAAAFSQTFAQRVAIGKLLGPPVTAMAITFLLASIGVLPPGGSSSALALQSLSLYLATPLLLMGADVKAARKRCGPLLRSFFWASLGTVIASTVGIVLCGAALQTSMMGVATSAAMDNFNNDGLKIASALLAKNIGGGINYIAVCKSLNASPNAIAAGLCVDNIFALVYFPITSALASGRPDLNEVNNDEEENKKSISTNEDKTLKIATNNTYDTVSVSTASTVLSLAAIFTWVGEVIGGKAGALPCSTLLTVAFATLAPPALIEPLRQSGEVLGTTLLYLFFATAGAPGLAVAESVRAAFVPLGAFLTTLYGVHGGVLVLARRLTLSVSRYQQKRRRRQRQLSYTSAATVEPYNDEDEGAVAPQRLLVASSAAIGGPATAAVLAQANGWTSLVVPSLLVGNIGYAVATFLGIAFYTIFASSGV